MILASHGKRHQASCLWKSIYIDFFDQDYQEVVLEEIDNLNFSLAENVYLRKGDSFKVPAGKTILATVVVLDAGLGSLTLSAFNETASKCTQSIDVSK